MSHRCLHVFHCRSENVRLLVFVFGLSNFSRTSKYSSIEWERIINKGRYQGTSSLDRQGEARCSGAELVERTLHRYPSHGGGVELAATAKMIIRKEGKEKRKGKKKKKKCELHSHTIGEYTARAGESNDGDPT